MRRTLIATATCLFGAKLIAGCGSIAATSSMAKDGGAIDSGTGADVPLSSDGDVDARVFTEERILFIVQVGGMSVADPGNARTRAVTQVIKKHLGESNVAFAVISFDQASTLTTNGSANGFTSEPNLPNIATLLSSPGYLSDYEGALSAAAKLIADDAIGTDAATRGLTRYVVVFLAGPAALPQCTYDETPCGSTTCPSGRYCFAGACAMEDELCTIPRSEWPTRLSPPVSSELFPDLVQGTDFNTGPQVLRKVQELTALQSSEHIGSVELNAVLVFDPSVAPDASATVVGRREDAVALLKQVAEAGGGRYIDLSTSPVLPF